MDFLLEHVGKGLILVLALSLPCVLTAAAIGLIVGILQAVTQVQEQTIAAAPKIVFVFLVLLLGGGIMMNVMTTYIREAFVLAFDEVPRRDVHLLPPRSGEDDGTTRARAFFRQQVKAGNSKFDTMKAGDLDFPAANSGGRPALGVMSPGTGAPNSISERMTLNGQAQ